MCLNKTKHSPKSIPEDPWDWYIYLHEWLIFMGNVGKYTIHGSSGHEKKQTTAMFLLNDAHNTMG